jgi:two-component system sensor histidine kinase RegB
VDAAQIPERNWVNIQWLTRLRWAQTAGQAATVLVGQFLLAGALPIALILPVIGVGLVSNLILELYFFGERRAEARSIPRRPVHEWQIALVMMIDIGVLTGLLFLTGGPRNPFGFLFLVQIALAVVLVRAFWTWMLVGLSFVGFGVLLLAHKPLAIEEQSRAIGVWVALGVASAFVVHFLRRITGALAERDAELRDARELAARQERLASLTTMAAGAAHELSTPLGTVSIAAKELERALASVNPDLAADARLIREQVGRCRAILEQMQQGSGTIGENVASCTVAELIDELLVGVRDKPAVHRDVPADLGAQTLRVPRRALSQALRSLVTNAQDASAPTAAVVVSARRDGETLELAIVDRGAGMPSDVMARIGEPFYTTKAPGRGMGLGLYLARAVIEGVGGQLVIESRLAGGTDVRVSLPVDVSPRRSAAGGKARTRESAQRAVESKPA